MPMRKTGKAWAVSALSGLSVLGAVRLLGPWLGFALCINAASALTALLLGLPGVVGLLLLRVLFLT